MTQPVASDRTDSSRRPGAAAWRICAAPVRLFVRYHPEHAEGLLPTGATVLRGQRLSNRLSQVHATPLASAPGIVHAIHPHHVELHCQSDDLAARQAIVSPCPLKREQVIGNLASISPEQLPRWIERCIAMNIGGNRVACPDFMSQLRNSIRGTIDTIICSALDSDPQLPFASAVTSLALPEITTGVRLLSRLTGAGRMIIVDDSTREAIPRNDRWTSAMDIRIARVINDFPQADPTLLLYELLNRKLRPGRLPVEVGVLLIDAPLAWALGRAAQFDLPRLDIPVAVRDHVNRVDHLAIIPAGACVQDVLDQLSIKHESMTITLGDLLRQQPGQKDTILDSGELTLHLHASGKGTNPDPCVRCGWCEQACPTCISPVGLLEAAQRNSRPLAIRYGLQSCIECGICTFVCPSRLPILKAIRSFSPPR